LENPILIRLVGLENKPRGIPQDAISDLGDPNYRDTTDSILISYKAKNGV